MRQTHVNNKMRKEDIFRQLDSFSDRGGRYYKGGIYGVPLQHWRAY